MTNLIPTHSQISILIENILQNYILGSDNVKYKMDNLIVLRLKQSVKDSTATLN